jgi:hypothetical protein
MSADILTLLIAAIFLIPVACPAATYCTSLEAHFDDQEIGLRAVRVIAGTRLRDRKSVV